MTEKGKSPYSYDMRYAKHRVGITLYDVEKVIVKNLTVRGFKLDGINAHDNAMDCVLYDVTAVANGRSGIAINGASRVKVVESKAHSNAIVQLRCDDWSTTELIDSELKAETSPVWTRHVNSRGQGARLFVNDVRQDELQGWWTKKDSEEQLLKESLDDLEAGKEPGLDEPAAEEAAAEETIAEPDATEPAPANEDQPLDEIPGDDEPAGDLFDDIGDEPTEDAFGEGDDNSSDSGDMEEDDPFADF